MKKTTTTTAQSGMRKSVSSVIVSPRITEKATRVAEGNTYTFNVSGASKTEIKQAVIALYKVTPIKIRVVTIRKQSAVRGTRGARAAGRKAYVTLKKGDTIKLM